MTDNKDLKKNINSEEIADEENEGIAMEILKELKRQNQRLTDSNKRLTNIIGWFMALIALIIAGFLVYLYQYDFSGSIQQNGVYTLVDSNGNAISSDITPEQMEDILKILNGNNEGN